MASNPLNHEQLRDLLIATADELGEGEPITLIVGGGAVLVFRGLRDSTEDVDSIRQLDTEVVVAAAAVAERRGLAPKWLNSSAAAFFPQTLNVERCAPMFEHRRLRLLAVPPDQIFLMKLHAGRTEDYDDLVKLWPLTGFADPDEVAAMCHEAFPYAPEDEFLAQFVREIAARATD